MLDIRLLRENPEHFRQRLGTRGGEAAAQLDLILDIDQRRRHAETQLQGRQAERKKASREIGARRQRGEATAEAEAAVRTLGEQITELEAEASALEASQRDLLLEVPNIPHEQAPVGADASANPEIRTWGQKPEFGFPVKTHLELGEKLRLFDFARTARMCGSAFVSYTGLGARLERGLINFLLDLHTREHGYTEIAPPVLLKAEALIGTSQLPKFEDQLYKSERDGLYLASTAEVPVTNLHREEILPLAELPLRYAAYTPCFRSEAGAAGLGTRGLIRMHQFDKVELVKIVAPEQAFAELETLTADAEKVLQLLGLHYRIIELCTGDLGFGSTKTYDIEVWAPGQNAYLEVSSCSTFGDFQARRMNLRFRDAEGKNRFCHTLNGSGTALPRLYVALLETYQQADGTILLPEVLQKYLGVARLS